MQYFGCWDLVVEGVVASKAVEVLLPEAKTVVNAAGGAAFGVGKGANWLTLGEHFAGLTGSTLAFFNMGFIAQMGVCPTTILTTRNIRKNKETECTC